VNGYEFFLAKHTKRIIVEAQPFRGIGNITNGAYTESISIGPELVQIIMSYLCCHFST